MNPVDYKGKPIIGNIVNSNNPRILFFNPQICYDEKKGQWENIPKSAFPTKGSLVVKLQNDNTFDDVLREFCSNSKIVIGQYDYFTKDESDNTNTYAATSNSRLNKGFIFSEFSKSELLQIVDVDMSYGELFERRSLRGISLVKLICYKILVRCNDGICYGPFFANDSGDSVKIAPVDENFLIKKLEVDIVEKQSLVVNDDGYKYVFFHNAYNYLSTLTHDNSTIDWIDNSQIIDLLYTSLKSESKKGTFLYSRSQLQEIRNDFLSSIPKTIGLNSTERRIKAEEIIANSQLDDEFFNLVIESTLKKESSRIVKLFENSEHFALIQNKLPEIQRYKDKITELTAEVETLRDTKKDLQMDEDHTSAAYLLREDKISKLQSELDLVTKDYELIRGELNQIKESEQTLEKLQKDIREAEVLAKQKYKVEAALKEVIAKYNDESKVIIENVNTKLLDKICREIDGNANCHPHIKSMRKELKFADYATANQLIDTVHRRLLNYGYFISRDSVTNYLICITQSFITTFAGEPGTGKTSLCNLLAKSLGLISSSAENGQYFIEVSVERGWASHKDLVAYYNPLSNRLEISNAELYNFLKIADNEDDCLPVPPHWVLLDEANLSPIEHYWAAFLKMSDAATKRSRILNFGGNEVCSIPNSVKFLATVNFDHTTEPLSPRFLDRSWVIILESEHISYDEDNETLAENNDEEILPISCEKLNEFFAPNADSRGMDTHLKDRYNSILHCFKDAHMPLSPRIQKMVLKYVQAAQSLMEMSVQNQYIALDYAIAQKVLPLINGCGSKYIKLLDELKSTCSGMPICVKHIDRIIKNASENSGYYQFFSRN